MQIEEMEKIINEMTLDVVSDIAECAYGSTSDNTETNEFRISTIGYIVGALDLCKMLKSKVREENAKQEE